MKKNIRIKGRLRFYLRAALYMGILLLFVNVGVFMLNENAGWILAIFSFLYYLLFILLYVRLKPVISEELVNFATEYGQVQKRLLSKRLIQRKIQ